MPPSISLNELNTPQRHAVECLSGPLLVLAGAGTGKTRVVTYRISNLIRHGTKPDRILAVTFTNKAANEMKERVTALLGRAPAPKFKRRPDKDAPPPPPEPMVSTFHSLCVKILRRHIDKLGYPLNFSICDRRDQEGIARDALREIRVTEKMLKASELLNHISRWKSASVRPQEAATLASDDKEHIAAVGYRRYQQALKTGGSVDFDDLLLCTEDLFRTSVEARRAEAGSFDHILIDEYQDTNRSQYRIVTALASGHRNLCVVGDDDQSIYGWRGAEVKHILRFNKDWPDATVVRLEDNYRSTAPILEWANTLIVFNKTRHDKQLKAARMGGEKPAVRQFQTETDEAEQTVLEIRRLIDTKRHEPGEIAILFRTKEQPRLFESELRHHKVPYILIGSKSFFDRREIRDICSLMQILVRPTDDVALRRIINVPARGISKPNVDKLLAKSVSEGKPMWASVQNHHGLGLTSAAVKGCVKLQELVDRYRKAFHASSSLAQTLRRFIDEIGFLVEVRARCSTPEEATQREESIEQIVNAVSEYEQKSKRKKATLLGFLDDLAVSNRELETEKEKQLQRNSVMLMTMHSAKGLEFPRVYLIGMEEGILPHHRSIDAEATSENNPIEEERRLCYVGVTRAQDSLTISLALTRKKWGKPRPTDASRFLFEMTGQAQNFVPNRAARSAKARLAAARNSQRAKGKRPTKKGSKRAPSKTARPTKKKPPRS